MKVESIEEAAENFSKNHSIYDSAKDDVEYGFINGAKWQAERSYSKEDIITAFYASSRVWKNRLQDWEDVDFEEWFEQFKK